MPLPRSHEDLIDSSSSTKMHLIDAMTLKSTILFTRKVKQKKLNDKVWFQD